MTIKSTPLGPGTLVIGPAGTPLDISCQMQNARIDWEKETADQVTMLCGDVKAGVTTYTASLTGTLDQDLEDPAGIVFYSWTNKGTTQPFVFVPNTAAGATVTGELIIDPISVGGDEGGQDMTSEIEWTCVGEPDLTQDVAGLEAAEA